mgnify:CR=1 FL=1
MPNKKVYTFYWGMNKNRLLSGKFHRVMQYIDPEFIGLDNGVFKLHAEEVIRKWNEEYNPSGYYFSLEEYYAE